LSEFRIYAVSRQPSLFDRRAVPGHHCSAMLRRRYIVAAAVFTLLLLICVLLLWRISGPRGTAADGRKVTLAKVTYGTEHSFEQGKLWVRVLKPIMGARWAAQRGCNGVEFTNATPALMIWTDWDGIYRTNWLATEATIVDEAGTESELVLSRWNAQVPWKQPTDPEANQAYVAWMFKNFPRRSGTLRLRIYDRDKRFAPTQAVEIAFSNPVRERFPAWRGEQLPLRKLIGAHDFILKDLRSISNALWQVDFEVRTNGQADHSWRIGNLTASDSSGNMLNTRSNPASTPQTNLSFALKGALWPEEPAWKLAVEFCRVVDLQPQELWFVRNIPVPARSLPFQLKTNLASFGTRPIEIHLETTPPQMPYTPRGISRNAHLNFRAPSADGATRLFLLKVEDDQRREAQIEPGYVSPDGLHTFGLRIPTNSQTLDLTFAIRTSTVVEFIVDSKRVVNARKP
jgi:hypothetical protein